MQERSPKLLELHAPYAKLLLRATHELMKQPQHAYEGPAYRLLPLPAFDSVFISIIASVSSALTSPVAGA